MLARMLRRAEGRGVAVLAYAIDWEVRPRGPAGPRRTAAPRRRACLRRSSGRPGEPGASKCRVRPRLASRPHGRCRPPHGRRPRRFQ
jgi:hypothetical protein